jgi:hypothetical protein
MSHIRDDSPFHTLWSKAKDQPGYDKSEWMALEKKLSGRVSGRVDESRVRRVQKMLKRREYPEDNEAGDCPFCGDDYLVDCDCDGHCRCYEWHTETWCRQKMWNEIQKLKAAR